VFIDVCLYVNVQVATLMNDPPELLLNAGAQFPESPTDSSDNA
jgi:hypothetical protein